MMMMIMIPIDRNPLPEDVTSASYFAIIPAAAEDSSVQTVLLCTIALFSAVTLNSL